jgi:type II secretory pathway pseudopilin PulG
VTPELIAALLGSGGIGAIVGAVSAWMRRGSVQAKKAAEALERAAVAEQALEVARQSGSNGLIDQLQEELREHRTAANARANAQDERLNRLDGQHDLAREHIHDLRSHIWEGKPPPPPPWPKGLPR